MALKDFQIGFNYLYLHEEDPNANWKGGGEREEEVKCSFCGSSQEYGRKNKCVPDTATPSEPLFHSCEFTAVCFL